VHAPVANLCHWTSAYNTIYTHTRTHITISHFSHHPPGQPPRMTRPTPSPAIL